jgi:uncharacterized membrane protein
LAVFGLILGELDSGVAVILVNYSLLFLFATIGLGWNSKRLLTVAALWAIVVPVVSHLVRRLLPATSFLQPSFSSLGQPVTLLRELLLTGYYPVLPWLAYILAGMGVGRLDLTANAIRWRLVGAGAALAAGSWAFARSNRAWSFRFSSSASLPPTRGGTSPW